MPGFAFWGLFAVFGAIVVAYLIWMFWTERREAGRGETAEVPDPEDLR